MLLNVEFTMIKKFRELVNKVVSPQQDIAVNEVKCEMDEESIPCDMLQENFYSPEANGTWGYTGVPAPVYLKDDEWFGPAPVRSEKQLDYMEEESLIKQQQAQETHEYNGEPCSIHQLMYEMATSNWNTVDETRESIGGSENLQTGPGEWSSGTGLNQFRGH